MVRQSSNAISKAADYNNIGMNEKNESRTKTRLKEVFSGTFRSSSSPLNLIQKVRSVLLVGPASAGKTLFLKSLVRSCEVFTMRKIKKFHALHLKSLPNLTTSTIPTVGVETSSCTYDSLPLSIREVGSALAPMWPEYLDTSSIIFFIVDSSSLVRASVAKVELCNMFNCLMKAPNKTAKPIAIILNKVDLSNPSQIASLNDYLRLDELCENYRKWGGGEEVAKVFELSAFTGHNVENVLQWLRKSGA